MGLTGKLKDMSTQFQHGAQRSTISLAHILLRLISGFFIGFVLALILQEVFKSGTLMLIFCTLLFMGIVYKLLSRFTLGQIVIFDLICVLIGALLRMYILMAP